MGEKILYNPKLMTADGSSIKSINQNCNGYSPKLTNTNNEIISENTTTIKNFYKNAEIFITGATGFLGKALIEKLLRSCDELKHIYILLRPKRGLTSEQRHKEFIKNIVFDRIRQSNPDQLDKIICIAGDITQPELILDDYYKEKILNNVNIVFHMAATIRFNESLRVATDLNTFGTQRVLDMCCQMKQIKSFVHVSTAFSNSYRNTIDEIVYSTHPIDKDTILNCLNSFHGDDINLIADRIQGKHPNTYTLTKSMAESIVLDYHTKLPVCIVRPSIVTGAVSEPYPGWIDNIAGMTGILMEVGRGTISSVLCKQDCIVDLIPVDIVVKTLIAAAWQSTSISKNIQVYNCTSGTLNSIKWKHLGQLTEKYARKNPTNFVMLYPSVKLHKNRLLHKFYEIFYHFLPALLFDVVMRAQGSKPMMMKIARKFKTATEDVIFFTTHEWQFENDNLTRLINNVRMTKDAEEFDCSVAWDWHSYVENYMLGIRKFVLKDDLDSMKSARLKVKRLLWIKRLLQLGLIIYICYFIFNRFNYLS